MKKLTLLLVLLLLTLTASAVSTVSAQDSSNWQVVVYADGANALQVLSADGVDRAIPAGTLPLKVGTFPSAPLVALSSSRATMAALNFTPGVRLSVTIAAGGGCCATWRISEFGVTEANIGPFSPDGTLFPVSYVAPIDESKQQYEAAIVIMDAGQGIPIARLDGTRFGGDYAIVRDWTSKGIDFQPTCYKCAQEPTAPLTRWDPVKDIVTPNVAPYDPTEEILDATGETIVPAHRTDYPVPIGGSAAQANVVAYGDDGHVIYYNPNDLQVNAAHWVADGWDVLVEHPDGDVLLDRSDVQHPISITDQFLVGTPDGWLGVQEDNSGVYNVVHHTLSDSTGTVIAHFYHPIAVLQAPYMGATASQGGFGAVTSPVSVITCPNGLPPRLVAGGKGQAVGSINLRTDPSLGATLISVLTSETFDVISGPKCDPSGTVWWEIGVGSLKGWAAESNQGQYLLRPVQN